MAVWHVIGHCCCAPFSSLSFSAGLLDTMLVQGQQQSLGCHRPEQAKTSLGHCRAHSCPGVLQPIRRRSNLQAVRGPVVLEPRPDVEGTPHHVQPAASAPAEILQPELVAGGRLVEIVKGGPKGYFSVKVGPTNGSGACHVAPRAAASAKEEAALLMPHPS
jgi:hypothetical protein